MSHSRFDGGHIALQSAYSGVHANLNGEEKNGSEESMEEKNGHSSLCSFFSEQIGGNSVDMSKHRRQMGREHRRIAMAITEMKNNSDHRI